MRAFAENFRKVGDDERLHRYKIKIHVFGDLALLPAFVREAIAYAEERTKDYDDYFFNLAVAYGARQEILDAIRELVVDAQTGRVTAAQTGATFCSNGAYTAALPDLALALRWTAD